MEQTIMKEVQPTASQMPEINKEQEPVKAAHLSSNPINENSLDEVDAHFENEVRKAFFRVFFGL